MQIKPKRLSIFAMFCLLAIEGPGCAEYFPRTQAQSEALEMERYQNAQTGIFAVPWDPPAYEAPAPPPLGYLEPTLK